MAGAGQGDFHLAGVKSMVTANGKRRFYYIEDGLHYCIPADFNLNSLNNESILLTCLISGCPGTSLWEGFGLVHKHAHDHLPNPLFPNQLTLRAQIIERIRNGDPASYTTIFEEESSKFSRAVQAKVPWKHIYPEMKATRSSLWQGSVQCLEDVARVLEMPNYAIMSSTIDGEDNMYSKLEDLGCKGLLFCSARNASFLSRIKSVISLTKQVKSNMDLELLVLVGKFGDFALPLVYCLFDKSGTFSSYLQVFKHLKELNIHFNPTVVVTPYNSHMKEAWESVYPCAEVFDQFHHCFIEDTFDFLKTIPIVSKNFKKVLHLCCSIPLVPHACLHEAFRHVNEEAMHNAYEEILPLFHHVWDTWLSGKRYDMESVSTTHHILCSSNVAIIVEDMLKEANLHLCLNEFALIGAFAELENEVKAVIAQVEVGIVPRMPQGRRVKSLLNSKLLDELNNHNIGTEEYLDEISHTVAHIVHKYL